MSHANAFTGLEPRGLWNHFEAITRIPRPSGQEQKMAEYICAWASARGWPAARDAVGNLCVHVPGRPPFAAAPPVVLQSHLDMVCERNADSPYDAARGLIHVVRDGDWLRAEKTTLGADNGIGCAAMLYVAELENMARAPLDLLFTLDEERGLTGVKSLDPAIVRGRRLLNLDSEDETMLVVGCAGGRGSAILWSNRREPAPGGWKTATICVTGLQGGHSGLEIDKGRMNAIRALARTLRAARHRMDLRMVAIDGGEKTNAIPRECRAVVAYPSDQDETLRAELSRSRETLVRQYGSVDPGLIIRVEAAPDAAPAPFPQDGTRGLLDLLCTLPTGVIALSPDMPGLVETSNNLGAVHTAGDEVKIRCSSRSSAPEALRDLLDTLGALARMSSASIQEGDGYPGWKPNLSSRLLAVTRAIYKRLFDAEPVVTAIHAGLECGLLGERIPGMDMISLGPQISGVLAPGESVRISSVRRFCDLLTAVIGDLSAQERT